MTNADRDRIRNKQNQLLDIALDKGIDMQLQIDGQYAGSPMLCQLVDSIWPEWEASIDRAIRHLTNKQ